MRVGFSYLSEHKFRYNFANSWNPLCSCCLETESTLHFFFLRSQNYTTLRRGLMSELKNNDFIMSLNENDLLHVVMYANENFDRSMNIIILSICDYKIYQRFWKIWPNSFSTIIKTTLVPPSIPFLNFLFKNSVVLQLEFSSWYVFALVLFCFIYLPLLILIFIYLF